MTLWTEDRWQNLYPCSQYYTRFKMYCCEAYNILRKSSNLILNLFHLMAGSNIPDIASDPEKGILKVGISTCVTCRIWHRILIVIDPLFHVNSFKRSSIWTWTTRHAYISFRVSSLIVLMLYFPKWLRPFIGGPSTGGDWVTKAFVSSLVRLSLVIICYFCSGKLH